MKTLQERFEEKYVKMDGCWEWTACKSKSGYGYIGLAGRTQYAHRVSYQLYVGTIPDGLTILHRCDNPGCVRPDHLLLGTQTDNMRDCMVKGRVQSGERNGHSKLTEEQVKTIRARRNNGALTTDLARQYGVTPQAISKIACYRRWTSQP